MDKSPIPDPAIITVSLRDLQEGQIPFSTLDAAFGPTSLGILLVKDLPSQYSELRRRLLSYSAYLANLPAPILESLECADAKWLIGWSCGRETLKSGVFDTHKGSYYVNCAFSKDPTLAAATSTSSEHMSSFPGYTAPTIWPPEEALPTFRATFEELCRLIIDTAVLVARACDAYAQQSIDGYKVGCLEEMVKGSTSTKARLLHYFPATAPATAAVETAAPVSSFGQDSDNDGRDMQAQPGTTTHDARNNVQEQQIEEGEDDWCATHLDHGCLTGLTSALYINETQNPPILPPQPLPPISSTQPPRSQPQLQPPPSPPPLLPATSAPSPKTGLYIRSRSGKTVKVDIPPDHLAFQTGLALEVITRGRFRAVPHFVRGSASGAGSSGGRERVSRNTLAVFTQPNLDEMIDETRDFASFAREIVERNH